jgi:hypothetical protein
MLLDLHIEHLVRIDYCRSFRRELGWYVKLPGPLPRRSPEAPTQLPPVANLKEATKRIMEFVCVKNIVELPC